MGGSVKEYNAEGTIIAMSTYCVIDLEMCQVPRGSRTRKYSWANEIIEIGAVLLDEDYKQKDMFCTFVKPEFGYIDYFIEKLTAITAEKVGKAPSIKEALEDFLLWLPDDAIMVAWSDTDKSQLRHEAKAKGLESERLAQFMEEAIDCQKLFSERLQTKRAYALEEALAAADIELEGRAHDGLDDAYNTAKLFTKLRTEPELKLNPIYENARRGDVAKLTFTMADLFKGMSFDPAPDDEG